MTNSKGLPDYTLIVDELESSMKYTVWEHDICVNSEMYVPNTILMFQLNVTSKNESLPKKLKKFYDSVKHLSCESLGVQASFESHGLTTGKMYHIAEVEIYVNDLELSKPILKEVMRHYKLLCSYITPMMTIDINMSKINNSNLEKALDIASIVK